MRLRLKITAEEVLVYRRKWAAFAVATTVALGCIGFSAFLWSVARDRAGASLLFLALFCVVFAAAGLAALLRMPVLARRLRGERGAPVLLANGAGLALTPVLGASTTQLAWSAVAEVVLADTFRVVDQGETNHLWGVVIVLLAGDRPASRSWLENVKAGTLASGTGRGYLLAGCPRAQTSVLEQALRRVAPAGVRIRRHPRVVFDLDAATDQFLPDRPLAPHPG